MRRVLLTGLILCAVLAASASPALAVWWVGEDGGGSVTANTVIAVVCDRCVGGVGHIGLIVTDWRDAYYLSFGLADGTDATINGPGQLTERRIPNGASLPVSSLMAHVNNRFRFPGGHYDRAIVFPNRTPEQVAAAIRTARLWANRRYDLLVNNCLSMAHAAVTSAGVRTSFLGPFGGSPNEWLWQMIRYHVKQGKTPGAWYIGRDGGNR